MCLRKPNLTSADSTTSVQASPDVYPTAPSWSRRPRLLLVAPPVAAVQTQCRQPYDEMDSFNPMSALAAGAAPGSDPMRLSMTQQGQALGMDAFDQDLGFDESILSV